LNRIKAIIFKQYNTGTWIGWIQSLYTQVQGDYGAINFLLIAVMAWGSNVGANVRLILPWFNFPLYILSFVIGGFALMLLRWKFVYPSIVLLSNQQGYVHGSPIKADFEDVKKELVDMRKEISELKELLAKETRV
jgi:hypothetical protein